MLQTGWHSTTVGAFCSGYLAPEYLLFGQLSEKADVFSFGVLLLEIITGRKNRNPKIQDNEYLPIYVSLLRLLTPYHAFEFSSFPVWIIHTSEMFTQACRLHGDGKLMDLLDRRLQLDSTNTTELKQVHRVLKAAILCAQMSPEQRPTMFRVLTMLAGDVDVEVPKTIDTISWSEFRSHQLSGSSSTATRSRSTMMYGDVTVELSSMKSILTNQILAEASCWKSLTLFHDESECVASETIHRSLLAWRFRKLSNCVVRQLARYTAMCIHHCFRLLGWWF